MLLLPRPGAPRLDDITKEYKRFNCKLVVPIMRPIMYRWLLGNDKIHINSRFTGPVSVAAAAVMNMIGVIQLIFFLFY